MPAPTNLNDIDLELGAISPRNNTARISTINNNQNEQEGIEDFELNIL